LSRHPPYRSGHDHDSFRPRFPAIVLDPIGSCAVAALEQEKYLALMAELRGVIAIDKSSLLTADIRARSQKASAKILPHLQIEIVKRSDQAKRFELLPRRWVVDRTFGGLIAAGARPAILKISPETHSLFSATPRFASSSKSFV